MLALPQPEDDLSVHRWLCAFAAALIPTFGLLLWSTSEATPGLPTLGWALLFVLFAGLVVGSFRKEKVHRRLPALARPLYGLLLVWTLVGGVLQSFSTEYAVVLLLVYTLTGLGLSVGLDRAWPLAAYFGAAMLFVGVVYFRSSQTEGVEARFADGAVDPLVIFGYLIGIGLVAFVVLSARIRAQHRLARSRARYRLLSENAFDLITLCAPSGEHACRYASPAAQSLLGYAPDELVGRSLMELAALRSRSDLQEALEAIGRSGERRSVTVCFQCKDDTAVWLEANGQAVLDPDTGTPSEIVLVLRDVTARKERERKLCEARDDARQAARAARETARAKTTFLAAMSHEVRTPLVSILGFADVLAGTLEEGEERELVELIRQGGQRLSATLDSVLDLARIEAGAVNPTPRSVPLAAHLRTSAAQLRPRAESKGLAFHLDLPDEACCARVDPTLLSRITTNLVTNAIKFTDEGSVTLGARCTRPGQVALIVEDTGQGIPSDFRPHLFEEFKQAPSAEGERIMSEGSGLGLFIVDRLVEHCGGTVSVDSTLGEGSRFTVRLPRAEDAPPDADAPTASDAAPSPARVLVVEDHDDTRRLIKRLLQPPHHVVTASGPGDALHAARQHDFDVFLLDINLAGHHDGVDLLHKLRALPNATDTPAVAVTAYALPEDRTRLLEAGFDDYLSKPFVREQLTNRLRTACRLGAQPSRSGSHQPAGATGDGHPAAADLTS